jgi:hypothetical protein
MLTFVTAEKHHQMKVQTAHSLDNLSSVPRPQIDMSYFFSDSSRHFTNVLSVGKTK